MPQDDLPDHWTASAREAVEAVLIERPDLAGAEFALLAEAAELITTADQLRDAAAGAVAVKGSMGQVTTSPLIVEARLSRTAAGSILRSLVPPRPAAGSRGGNGRFRSNAGGTGARR